MASGPFEDRDESAGSPRGRFFVPGIHFPAATDSGLYSRSVRIEITEAQADQMGSGMVLFSGLVWEVRKAPGAVHSHLLSLCVSLCVSF